MSISMRRVAVALAIGLTVAGCGSSQTATPFVPAATPSSIESPSETPIASETPAASESVAPTLAPTLAPTVAPTVAPTDTPAPTLPPVSAGDATKCLGWATDGAEFTKAAKGLKFNVNVYCAVLPSGWYVSAFNWAQPHAVAGSLVVTYKRKTAVLTVSEGNFCSGCAYADLSDLGSASFGGLPADLKLRSAGTYALYVNPGATVQYQMVGKGMTQAAFVAMAAAMVKVPKA
jgi:hypothetical protein